MRLKLITALEIDVAFVDEPLVFGVLYLKSKGIGTGPSDPSSRNL
jgi:hypothetical protein